MDREDVLELAIGVAGVGLFIAGLAAVGMQYGVDEGIDPSGRIPVLGVLTLFILVMGAAGFWLAERG